MAHAQGGADEAVIREQAYYFWEQDGRPDGREMEYWSRAAVAVAGKDQMDKLTAPAPKPSAAAKLKASKLKAAPVKAIKIAAKVRPKKK